MNIMLEELQRCCRVADQLVTCHSILRDRYERRALILDILILVLSAWVTAVAFVDPTITAKLVIWNLTPAMTIGSIATATFCLSLIQMKVDWKQRSDRHGGAARAYAAVKFLLGRAMDEQVASPEEQKESLAKYHSVGDQHVPIPDAQFNRLKQRHLLKVAISKAISKNPGAPRLLVWFKLRLVDSLHLWRGK
jgi:hypothetical protein